MKLPRGRVDAVEFYGSSSPHRDFLLLGAREVAMNGLCYSGCFLERQQIEEHLGVIPLFCILARTRQLHEAHTARVY